MCSKSMKVFAMKVFAIQVCALLLFVILTPPTSAYAPSSGASSWSKRVGIDAEKMHKLTTLSELIVDWNTKVNIISRNPPPTPSHVMERHIAPSVALLSMMPRNVKSVVDVGTGGGFPGLPLALCMTETDFVLCDSVGKKLKVVNDMATQLETSNVQVHHGRAEEMKSGHFDVVVGRSVADLPRFCSWVEHLMHEDSALLYIKGGRIEDDMPLEVIEPLEDEEINGLLGADFSDKRVLKYNRGAVRLLAKQAPAIIQKKNKK
ncbi:hypothetical protein TrVE_jg921 [Triparma verrucosa]|uniref:Uncharacterized protein n=1 Tax=Triparma verrucosa TaxID=1606542 RepID=A0A9W7F7Y9_9STRA|nr:hypothetical protein TrVE_jg921 [Triparma verrucosa]